MGAIGRLLDRLRQQGVASFLDYIRQRRRSRALERHYRIQTIGEIECRKLGIDESLLNGYCPVGFDCLKKVLNKIPLRAGVDSFIDYGAGMGRVVVVAATDYPFRRVIGIEIRKELADIADKNIELARPRLQCSDTVMITDDARTYEIPNDVAVAFFFNPFRGQVLSDVLDRIRESVEKSPRRFWVPYVNPSEATESQLKSTPWLKVESEYTDWFIPGAKGKVILFEVVTTR